MQMWTLRALVLAGVLALLPLRAQAVCFNASPLPDIIVIEVVGNVGPFFSLVGEVVNWCGAGTSMPASGTAHIRPDGKAHFGISVHGPVGAPASCVPGWYQGVLNPPNFNAGAGFHRNDLGGVTAITFMPVACPALPQSAETDSDQGGGTVQPNGTVQVSP